jgi:hypothetical protein
MPSAARNRTPAAGLPPRIQNRNKSGIVAKAIMAQAIMAGEPERRDSYHNASSTRFHKPSLS